MGAPVFLCGFKIVKRFFHSIIFLLEFYKILLAFFCTSFSTWKAFF